MEPLGEPSSPGSSRPRLSRRKLAIAGGALAAVVVAVVVVVLLVRGGGGPDENEVANKLTSAIGDLAPSATGSGATARFDTAALRNRLEGELDGWYVDLAADSGATRIGAAARQLDGGTCVFAWSDVGAARSAVVTDPAMACVAEIALIMAKSPA